MPGRSIDSERCRTPPLPFALPCLSTWPFVFFGRNPVLWAITHESILPALNPVTSPALGLGQPWATQLFMVNYYYAVEQKRRRASPRNGSRLPVSWACTCRSQYSCPAYEGGFLFYHLSPITCTLFEVRYIRSLARMERKQPGTNTWICACGKGDEARIMLTPFSLKGNRRTAGCGY